MPVCTVKSPICFTINYRGKMVISQSKALFAPQSTAGVKWSFCSQKSYFLVNISFWDHNHHLIKSWSWFHKNSSKIIKMQKFPFLDSWKVNCKLTKASLFHGSSEKSHPMLILKGMTFPKSHLHIPSPRNALTKNYQFLHYRSNSKVNKKAL